MTVWTIHAGATYLAPSGPGNYQHLFVILNDPFPFPNTGNQPSVCVVNFSTPTTHIPYDQTCIVKPAVHPFLKHDSFVYFKMARAIFVRDVEANIKSGIWTPYTDDVSAATLQELRDGLASSPQSPRDLKVLKL